VESDDNNADPEECFKDPFGCEGALKTNKKKEGGDEEDVK
jgi:hypothetical protein